MSYAMIQSPNSVAGGLKVDLVTKEGFQSLNGPLPEFKLMFWGRWVCTEVRVKQDLVQQHVVNVGERPGRC